MRVLIPLLICASTMAADVTGKWNVSATTSSGREYKLGLDLKNEGGKLAGAMSTPDGNFPLQDVQLSGDQLTYRLTAGEASYTIKFTVAGDTMKGTWTALDGASGNASAVRAGGGVAGRWKAVSKSDSGRQREVLLQFTVTDGTARGTLDAPEGVVDLTEVKVEGDQVSFKVPTDEVTYTVKLTLSGGVLKGSYSSTGGESGTVTATR